jgi:hypothetical protein
MTDTALRADELFRLPVPEALAAMRAQGLLPATTTETRWAPDPTLVQPAAAAALAQIDPRRPYTAGRASLSASAPQFFSTGIGEVSIRDEAGLNAIFFNFQTLGANRKCIAWFDLRVYGPGSTSLTLGGTGNPSTVVVTNQATAGQKVSVPYALTALPDGRASAYVVPSFPTHGGVWYGTTVYGL